LGADRADRPVDRGRGVDERLVFFLARVAAPVALAAARAVFLTADVAALLVWPAPLAAVRLTRSVAWLAARTAAVGGASSFVESPVISEARSAISPAPRTVAAMPRPRTPAAVSTMSPKDVAASLIVDRLGSDRCDLRCVAISFLRLTKRTIACSDYAWNVPRVD
jgi:hypothetical protein